MLELDPKKILVFDFTISLRPSLPALQVLDRQILPSGCTIRSKSPKRLSMKKTDRDQSRKRRKIACAVQGSAK